MEEQKKVASEYDTHDDDSNKPVPLAVMENEFINSRRYIRPKIVKGKLSCKCGYKFPSIIPFYAVRVDATEEVICHPCSYKRMGMTVEQYYKAKRPDGEIASMKEQNMERSKANQIAKGILSELAPYCEQAHIAGSLRRLKPDPKDIEIVALPKSMEAQDGLFDTKKIRAKEFISKVAGIGKVLKGSPVDGRYVCIELGGGLKLDLFIPQEADFWRQYVIRTGSADYVKNKIASAWSKLGWCGTEDGLRLIDQCEAKKDKSGNIAKWICTADNPSLPPVWQSEKEFFEWLTVPYVEPQNRIK